jgi:Kef-type K+ transport system membrane component KefB/nucleotide-binding universal stress UspA family protein
VREGGRHTQASIPRIGDDRSAAAMTNSVVFPSRYRGGPFPAAAVLLGLSTAAAFAAESAGGGPSDVIFLAELIILILVGRLLGEAMVRIGQPSIMGQLLAGILLGPSLFGWLWPDLQHWIFPADKEQKGMIDAISQFGILLLLLLTGMETDLKLVRKVRRAAAWVSLTGVAVPFACGVALGLSLPERLLPDPGKRLLTSLFLGIALSISSIKIVAAIVREMNFTRRNLGQVIVASAIMEDTIGWIIIAITFGLAEAGTISIAHVAMSVLGTAVFLLLSFTIARPVVFYLIRWANDNFKSEFPVISTILVIMGVMALTTHLIGVHTVLGAFVAGVLIGESPILTKHIDEQLRGLIMAFFMPVFFGMAGLSADLTVLRDPRLLLLALGLIAIASLGKFAGAFIGGAIGGLRRREALALACGMNARGSTEVIVASIGLSMGALTQDLFTMIVAMAFVTTMGMPPMLRWSLARVPLGKAERERLEREEFEAKGFVPNLERLLLVVDESPNGRFASHIAGLIASRGGLPTTVLPKPGKEKPSGSQKSTEPTQPDPEGDAVAIAERTLRAAAEDVKKTEPKEDEPTPAPVTVRKASDSSIEEAITSEAKKGYDLLFIGLQNTKSRSGGFNPEIAGMAIAFEGPLAIVMGQGYYLKQPDQCRFNILVPVTGTNISRRAAEVAIAVARACESPMTALYVANTGANAKRRGGSRERRQEQAILKEVVQMADRYDVEVRTAVRADVAPDQAILAQAKEGGHDLIVMGVQRRPGDKLFFGDTAASIFEKSPISVLFLSS